MRIALIYDAHDESGIAPERFTHGIDLRTRRRGSCHPLLPVCVSRRVVVPRRCVRATSWSSTVARAKKSNSTAR